MKAKYALIAFTGNHLFGCDDNTAGLGLGMFPGSAQDLSKKTASLDYNKICTRR